MPSNSSDEAKAAPAKRSRGRRLWEALHDFFRSPLNGFFAFVGVAAVLAVSFVAAEELNIRGNSTEFCISCHSMEAYVYKEFQKSKHYLNASGVRPECGTCHVSRRFLQALWEHAVGTHDLIGEFVNDWTKAETFEGRRSKMAERARLKLLGEDSHTCRECHKMEAIVPTRKRGERAHKDAIAKGKTNCIACHYNLVHNEAPLTPAFTQAIKEATGTL